MVHFLRLRHGESHVHGAVGTVWRTWYRVQEFYFSSRRENRQLTDEEYAAALENLAGGREIRGVIVDPSAASFQETPAPEGLLGSARRTTMCFPASGSRRTL